MNPYDYQRAERSIDRIMRVLFVLSVISWIGGLFTAGALIVFAWGLLHP